jgi:hypothetical protein
LKEKILIALIILSGKQALSQQLSQQVLSPAAVVIYCSGISYSQTVGETAVEIFSSADYVLTQGFQQPRINKLPGDPPQGYGVKVYPNPAREYFYVELYGETGKTMQITVTNLSGTTLYSAEESFTGKYWNIHEIPVSGFSTGLYFIQVISKDKTIRRSFKIEKL